MIDQNDGDRPTLCDARSVPASEAASPCTDETLAADEVVRCANDVIGRYRITPDYGEPVAVWLCNHHRNQFHDRSVELAVVE